MKPSAVAWTLLSVTVCVGCTRTESPLSLEAWELEIQNAGAKHEERPGWVVTTISAGDGYACATETDGDAYCWGGSRTGALGDGVLDSRRLTPTRVVGGHRFTSIATYNGHACALTRAGKAYCWGANDRGQLGDGTTTLRLEPTPVTGGHAFDSIAVAGQHTCAIERGGDAYCWGSNVDGQLGVGTFDDGFRSVPTPVLGGHAFVSIDVVDGGAARTCARTAEGAAYCWGFDGDRQRFHLEPTLVPGDVRYTEFRVGLHNVCGISHEGDTYCWGDNDPGVPVRVGPTLVEGGHSFVALGDLNVAYLGLDERGDVYEWGPKGYQPVQDTDGFGFVTFTGGRRSSSAVVRPRRQNLCALDADGVAWCWGDNELGQLGDGTTAARAEPGRVARPREPACVC